MIEGIVAQSLPSSLLVISQRSVTPSVPVEDAFDFALQQGALFAAPSSQGLSERSLSERWTGQAEPEVGCHETRTAKSVRG